MALLSEQSKIDRRLCQRSLYYLCKVVLGYKDMVQHVHGDLCNFLTAPRFGRYRQAQVPRSWFKTWTGTVGGSIWLSLPDEESLFKEVYPWKGPNARILIASNISDNAEKMVDKIRHEWMNNDRLQAAFPELVPEFNKVRWSNSCAVLNRTQNFTEGTYTSVGAGGGVVSQHFDHIIEDDLVYAKKDDFSGQELMPSQEDIDKAIGWHKLTFSLFSDPNKSTLWNIGTRWAPHDLIDYIRKTSSDRYSIFDITATVKDDSSLAIWPIESDDQAVWPERFGKKTLEEIRQDQGAKIFETQYLGRPRAGEDVTFAISYVKRHDYLSEFPQGLKYLTIVDLASWGDKKRLCLNSILTGARDKHGHIWVSRVDAGRFNPSEVISIMVEHQKQFNSKVFVEAVQYQKSLRHFARKQMDEDGYHYMIEEIAPDQRKNAKTLRIHALEPLVKNGALHILSSMQGLTQEIEDYPYSTTVDRLDCLGYLFILAPKSDTEAQRADAPLFQVTREALEEECRSRSRRNDNLYPFNTQLGNIDAYIN